MELWIRSQDKHILMKVGSLEVDNDIYDNENDFLITANRQDEKLSYILGTYSEERALEVLDEIQKYINNKCEFLEREQHTSMGTYINKEQMRVYEMPQE